MYEPYNREDASIEDRVAWALCQIIDDDAPLRWTRYRFVASCIVGHEQAWSDLVALRKQKEGSDV